MPKMKFYLDARRLKADGTAHLKISVTHRRVVRYVSTGIHICPDSWDAGKGRVTDSHPSHLRINNALSRIWLQAEDAFINKVSAGDAYSLPDLVEAVNRAVNPEKAKKAEDKGLLLTIYDRFLATKSRPKTIESYRIVRNHILAFAGEGTRLESVTRAWLLNFDAFLAKTAKSPNARAVYMRNLRAVFNFAIDEGVTDNYPFRRFHIKTIPTAKRALAVEDMRRLFNARVEPWQQPYLDFFKLSFLLVGTNPADLLGLGHSDLIGGRLVFHRAKTSRLYSLKVEPEAAAIIENYRGTNHLLSFMDSRVDYLQFLRQTNHALKTIGTESAKGRKPVGDPWYPKLTMYWARHTWATIARSIGISIDDIALALGHGDGHALTHIYLNESLQKIDEANRRVIDWVLYGKR